MPTKKVLLVNCPMWDTRQPPLGIAYIASYLEKKGIAVEIADVNIELFNRCDEERKAFWSMEHYALWSSEEQFQKIRRSFHRDIDFYVQQILQKGASVIGFSLSGANILFSIEIAAQLKKIDPRLSIVFGGPSCFFLHDNADMPVRHMVSPKTRLPYFSGGTIDAFVRGEGEESFYSLVSGFFNASSEPIPGTVVYREGKYRVADEQPLVKDLDDLPFPAWKKFPLYLYTEKEFLPIIFSRGCLYRCTFCNDWKMWQGKYRVRSAQSIVDEMKQVSGCFGKTAFSCYDLLFNGNQALLEAVADLLIQSDLAVQWVAQGSIKDVSSDSLLQKLRKSGLRSIAYGVESLSDDVLKKMNKPYTFADVVEALKRTKKARIQTLINLIAGFPTETDRDFELTRERLKEIKPFIDGISSLNPCNINAGTDLEMSPERFSIQFRDENSCNNWRSLKDTNSYGERKERINILTKTARQQHIKIYYSNLFFDTVAEGNNDSQAEENAVAIRHRVSHARLIVKWCGAILMVSVSAFYLGYLWMLEAVFQKRIFGGRRG